MRTLSLLCDICTKAAGALLLFLLCLTLYNIGLRFFAEQSLRGVVEISGYLVAAAIGLSLPQAQIRSSHIMGGMFSERLPRSFRRMQNAIAMLATIALMALLATETAALAFFVQEMNEQVDGWNFSYYGFVFTLSFACFLQVLVMIGMLLQKVFPQQQEHTS